MSKSRMTTKDIDVDQMLEANKGSFSSLIFAGIDKNGEFQCGSSIGDGNEIMRLLNLFKEELKAKMDEVK